MLMITYFALFFNHFSVKCSHILLSLLPCNTSMCYSYIPLLFYFILSSFISQMSLYYFYPCFSFSFLLWIRILQKKKPIPLQDRFFFYSVYNYLRFVCKINFFFGSFAFYSLSICFISCIFVIAAIYPT